jgi:hypothetical protein
MRMITIPELQRASPLKSFLLGISIRPGLT